MARRAIPLSDALLTATQASKLCRVSSSRWTRYWQDFDELRRGTRIVRAPGCKKGRTYWLRSYVIRHLHNELPTA